MIGILHHPFDCREYGALHEQPGRAGPLGLSRIRAVMGRQIVERKGGHVADALRTGAGEGIIFPQAPGERGHDTVMVRIFHVDIHWVLEACSPAQSPQ